MHSYSKSFSAFLLILLVLSCTSSQKIASFKPEPDEAGPLFYETQPSFINLPISVKLKDVENQTNALLNGLIYEDNTIEDDNIEIKIWKLAPITIENNPENSNGSIKTVLPLKAIIRYRIGTKTLGVSLYKTKEFNLNGKVTLVSDISLNNWKLNTKTQLKSLDWNESPTTTILGKTVPITYFINPTIKIFKSKIEKSIDTAIDKSMDFKRNVLAAIEKICTPFLIHEGYESWLQINPTEIYATNARLKNDTFLMEMGMKCTMETWIGKQPESKFDSSKIVLKPVAAIPNQISATITAISTYADASKIITKNFGGQVFGSGNKKIKVQNVSIWHKNKKMVIALDVLGAINGTIYLNGFPQYNSETKEIFFDKLDYALDTKNKLIRTANWLAQGLIVRKIQDNCRYSIVSNIEEGKKSMAKYLQNYSPLPGVFINGKLENLTFQGFQLTNKAIVAFVKINGTLTVAVDGLK